MDAVWSLVLAGALPGIGVVIDLVRWRTVEVVGAVVLGGIGLSVVLGLVTASADAVLVEGAAITGVFGAICLLSLASRRPLIFYFGQGLYGGRHSINGQEMDADYDRYAEARFFWRAVTSVWGVTHLALAAALVLVVASTSTGTALTFNRTVPWVLNGALLGWSIWWGERLRARKPDDD